MLSLEPNSGPKQQTHSLVSTSPKMKSMHDPDSEIVVACFQSETHRPLKPQRRPGAMETSGLGLCDAPFQHFSHAYAPEDVALDVCA